MNEFLTVYSAEIVRRLRSRIFIIGLLIGAFGLFALIKLPEALGSAYSEQARQIVVTGDAKLTARARSLLDKHYTVVATTPPTGDPGAELRKYGAKALIAIDRRNGALAVTAYAADPGDVDSPGIKRALLPLNLEMATNLPAGRIDELIALPVQVKTVSSKFGSVEQSDSAHVIAYLFLFLLYLLIVMNSQIIMSSVAEEKTSRIAELLIASVNPSSLLAGKIAASVTLALVQLAVWVLVTLLAGAHPSSGAFASSPSIDSFQFSPSDVSEVELLSFIAFFIFAFLQTVTLFAAAASLVNRTEDLGSVAGPLMIPVIVAFFIAVMALRMPDSPFVVVASFIPVLSPFVMFTRTVVTTVPGWQLAAAIAINIVAIWAIAVLGAKLYRVGMLLYGRPPKLSQVLKTLQAP